MKDIRPHNIINGIVVPYTDEEWDDFKKREEDHFAARKKYLENEKYKIDRNIKYIDRGVTDQSRLEALWERIVEGRPELSEEIQLIRVSVKSEIPKNVIEDK